MQPTDNRLVERRLSDFFREGAGSGPDALFADEAVVAAAVANGFDHRLYSAVRDVLPSRVAAPGPSGSGATLWSADQVVYEHGTLPGGEPFRSTGHWNPADQLEVFQVLSGRVLMLSSMTGEGGEEPFVAFQVCGPGELSVVPFGTWHLTYVLDGPAVVFNIYSGPADDVEGATPVHRTAAKYRSKRGPAEITVRRSGTGFSIELSDKWRATCGDPVEVSPPEWLRAVMPPSGLLTDLHVSGSDADLDALLAAGLTFSGVHPAEAVGLAR